MSDTSKYFPTHEKVFSFSPEDIEGYLDIGKYRDLKESRGKREILRQKYQACFPKGVSLPSLKSCT